jgi:hypothetical protein
MEKEIKDIKELVAKKAELIAFKKMQLKHADPVSLDNVKNLTTKGLYSQYQDDTEAGVIKRDLVANTYNWLDSHGDVHVGKTFKKSISENKNVYHLHDHKHEVGAKVGTFERIKEVDVMWTDLGVAKDGMTTILIGTSNIEADRNKAIFKQYLKGEIDQHSVGMQYVKIDLAVNDEEFEEEYKVWKQHIDKIGNKEEAIQKGHFWAVSEAKLVEISAVLWGSNTITPTVENIEPFKNTQEHEPPVGTQKEKVRIFVKF